MNIEKLNPWNWFKHEERQAEFGSTTPVKRHESVPQFAGAPLDSFIQLHREMDRLFDEAFRGVSIPSYSRGFGDTATRLAAPLSGFKPNLDVSGDDNHYEITLDVPGLKQEDISIEMKDRVLTIKGQTETKSEKDDKKFYRVERHYGSFQRTLSLPEDAVEEDITADMNDGVLTLKMPRKATAESDVKRINIGS